MGFSRGPLWGVLHLPCQSDFLVDPHVSERVSHRFFWKFKDDGRKGYLMNNIFSCM
jgi:hypothetical protein